MLLSLGGPDLVPEERLRVVGKKVEATTRDSDLVAHVGRGRFVVLLLGTNLQGARIAADRIELALADVGGGHLSFGLAAYENTMKDSGALLEAADKALLAAEAGGGGVEFA
jgi:diguanylate cyclase (GGDEF)-like protein